MAALGDSDLQIEQAEFSSGWPGTRGYGWVVGDGRPIESGSILVHQRPRAGAGAQAVGWRIVENKIEVSVTMGEGEALDPGRHQVMVSIIFRYL